MASPKELEILRLQHGGTNFGTGAPTFGKPNLYRRRIGIVRIGKTRMRRGEAPGKAAEDPSKQEGVGGLPWAFSTRGGSPPLALKNSRSLVGTYLMERFPRRARDSEAVALIASRRKWDVLLGSE
jgi:hypothetical protein